MFASSTVSTSQVATVVVDDTAGQEVGLFDCPFIRALERH